jgi:RHS repeat-associated protein
MVALGAAFAVIGAVLPIALALPASASTYSTTVLSDSPSIYYRLGESSGTTAQDSSGGSHNATYGAATTLGASGAINGDADTAVSNSAGSAVASYTGGTGLPTGNSARTVEAWFKSCAAGLQDIVSYGGSPYDNRVFGFRVQNGNQIFVYQWNSGVILTAPQVITDGSWHLVDVTYDGTTVTAYVDGVSIGSGTFPAGALNTASTTLVVGAEVDGASDTRVDGSLDDVAIYPSALSAARVSAHWGANPATAPPTNSAPTDNYGRAIFRDSPAAYWRFGEPSGTQMTDSGIAGTRAGTYTGAATLGVAGAISGNTAVTDSGSSPLASYEPGAGMPVGNSPRAVEAWFKSTYTGLQDIVGYGGSPYDNRVFGFRVQNGNEIYVYQWNGGAILTSPVTLTDGAWHLIDVSYDGTTVTVFVDGGSIGSGTFPAGALNTACRSVLLGSELDGASDTFVHGTLDEMAIYAHTLTPSQVANHWVASGRPQPALIGGLLAAKSRRSPSLTHAAECQCQKGAPVDTATGAFWHTFDDLTIPGRGAGLHMTHSYDTNNASTDGALGFGWTHPYNLSLVDGGSTVTVNEESGSQVAFTLSGSVYTAPPRVVATLVHNGDGTWTFTRQATQILSFDSLGRLSAERDLNGYTTTITRPNGTTMVVTDPAGRTLTLVSAGGHLTSVTDTAASARVVGFAYNDGAGNLTDVTDVRGGVTHFTYDASHRMLTMLDPNQAGSPTPVPMTNHFDAQGRVDWQKDFMGRQTSFDYTSIPGSTKVTDPKGYVEVDQYTNSVLTARTTGYGTAQAATWNYTHDPASLGTSMVIDPNGQIATANYDAAGNLVGTVDALGRTSASAFNSLHEPTSATDGNGVTTTMTYDSAGNLQSSSTPLVGAVPAQAKLTTYTYGDVSHPGDVTSITDPNAKVWPSSYSASGDLASSTDPLGNKAQSCYDNVGRSTATIAPKGFASGVTCATTSPAAYTTYTTTNAFGDVLTQTDPLQHQTVRTYDGDRNLKTSKDANLNLTQYAYDLDNELITVTRADQTTLTNVYDADGNRTSQKDGKQNATTYAFANAALPHAVTSVTDPNARVTTLGYDGAGNRLTKQDQGGNCGGVPKTSCTTFTFDAGNQLSSVTYSDGVTPNVTNLAYDGDGQRTAMTDGTGTSHWTWNSLHRMTSSANGAGKTIGYGYDLKGQMTSVVYPGTTGTVSRTYDDAGRLRTVMDWLSHQTTFNYDADSNMTSEVYPNSTTATYTPDGADRLMTIKDAPTASPNSPFASFTYGRDNANQLTSLTSTGVPTDNHTWGYTTLNQLKNDSATALGYRYDAADNLTQMTAPTTQAFDAANQLTASSSVTLVGTASGGNASTPNTVTVTLPTGTVANDQILVAATLAKGNTVTTPTGYTLVNTYTSGNGAAAAKVVLYRRTAVAGDTSVPVTFSASIAKAVTVAVYRGVDATTPLDVTPSSGSAAPGFSVTVPSLTTTKAGVQLLLIQGAVSSPAAGAWTAPSTMAQQVQQPGGTTVQAAMADQLAGTAGATGTRVATFSQSAQLVGVLVALRPATSTAYTFDTRGNRTTKTPSSGAATAYTYDQANRLKTAGATASYAYDGDGIRSAKTVSGVTSAFSWDVAEGLPKLLVDGTTNYVYGPGGLLLEQVAGSTVYYFHNDQLGSARVLTDSAGTVAATYTYDNYGKLTASTGSVPNPFGYAGEYVDGESGFQYLRARQYDPATGQFLNRDPMEAVTREAYAYARANPLNATDPTGLMPGSDSSADNQMNCHWWDNDYCQTFNAVTEWATRTSQDMYGVEDDGDTNAARHFLLSSMLTYVFGGFQATMMLGYHETGLASSKIDKQDRCADQHNNYVGIRFGKELDKRDGKVYFEDFTSKLRGLLASGSLDTSGGYSPARALG